MVHAANCIIIAQKRLKLRLSGSAKKSQKRFRDTPRFKFRAVLARNQPFLSRSVEKRGDQSRFKCRKMVTYYAIRSETHLGSQVSGRSLCTALSCQSDRRRPKRRLRRDFQQSAPWKTHPTENYCLATRLQGSGRSQRFPAPLQSCAECGGPWRNSSTRLQKCHSFLSFPYVCPEPVL